MKFLKVDLTIQRIIGIIYLGVGFLSLSVHTFFFIFLIAQLLLGGWQVLSALVLALSKGDKKRIYYLIGVVVYFIIVSSVVYFMNQRTIPESPVLFILGLILVPFCIAIWYYTTTLKDYEHSLKTPGENMDLKIELEDILDSEELGLGH